MRGYAEIIPGLTESWVELAPSRASLCSSVEAVMVDQDQGTNGGTNKDSRLRQVLCEFSSPFFLVQPCEYPKPTLCGA